jgi:hypothetical protein
MRETQRKETGQKASQKQTVQRGGIRVKVIVHDAEEGGFWAEVPALPGCITEGDTREELLENLRDAIEGCLLTGSGMFATAEPGGREEEIQV